MARSSRFALSILSLAVLALVLCATPIDAQRGQPKQTTKQSEGKAGAQEAPSSRLEEFTTTRNEADKLKAKWAAEKKKEEEVTVQMKEVSDEMPSAPTADIPADILSEDSAEIAAKQAAEEALRAKQEEAAQKAAKEQEEAATKQAQKAAAMKQAQEAQEKEEEAKQQQEQVQKLAQAAAMKQQQEAAAMKQAQQFKEKKEEVQKQAEQGVEGSKQRAEYDAAVLKKQEEAVRKQQEQAAEQAQLAAEQLAKERAAVEAEQRRKDAEAAAIEAAKTPEQRQAELEEGERFAMEQREQGLRLAEEQSRAEEAHETAIRAKAQMIEDMKGEGQYLVGDHHGHSMVLHGMHSQMFTGHHTFKMYHLGEYMGTATASRIYDIPAHSITEIHGIEMHSYEMLNRATHVTPCADEVHMSRQSKRAKQNAIDDANAPPPPPPSAKPQVAPPPPPPPPAAAVAEPREKVTKPVEVVESPQEEEELLM